MRGLLYFWSLNVDEGKVLFLWVLILILGRGKDLSKSVSRKEMVNLNKVIMDRYFNDEVIVYILF